MSRKLFHLNGDEVFGPPPAPQQPTAFAAASPSTPYKAKAGVRGRGTVKRDSRVSTEHLWCSAAQKSSIDSIYRNKGEFRETYSPDVASQTQVQAFLQQHALDSAAREMLESKWSKVWSRSWASAGETSCRALCQCACGYDTNTRQSSRKRSTTAPSERRSPYSFTGCLAHAEITYIEESGLILRVVGIFEHNEECRMASMERLPSIPVHPHVIEVALRQLRDGASLSAIQARNVQLHDSRAYRDQTTMDPLRANFRYILLTSDFAGIYRRHHKETGIDVTQPAHLNVDSWLDPSPKNPQYKPEIAQAIFHYHQRSEAGERFQLCICTCEMEEAAWMHVHGKQLILDGTFGLSSSRLLVWVAMGVDASGKGLPVAFMIFSASTGAKATYASYNTKILTELLTAWKTWMSARELSRGRIFEPGVAITDTDIKEQGALLQTWPRIILLLCRFHIRQCWTNKRSTLLGKGDRQDTFWKGDVRARVRTLEVALLGTTDYDSAKNLLEETRTYFNFIADDAYAGPQISKAGLSYLAYLHDHWMKEDLWRSWSQWGRLEAAKRLKIPVEGILPTTNHLESFNGVLKYKYIPQWQHSKHRLRFDVLIFHLIINIIPRMYALLCLRRHLDTWKQERFGLTGNTKPPQTVTIEGIQASQVPNTAMRAPFAWFTPDERHDRLAAAIKYTNHVVTLPSGRQYELWATCATSAVSDMRMAGIEYPRYWLAVHCTGSASCTCADWLQRGGACKHLRAFRDLILHWTSQGSLDCTYRFARSEREAEQWEVENATWYGAHYTDAITPTLDRKTFPQGYSSATAPPSFFKPQALLHLPVQTGQVPAAAAVLPPPTLDVTIPALEADVDDMAISLLEDGTPGAASICFPGAEEPATASEQGKAEDTHGSNIRAIAFQAQQRVEHEVAQLLPKLHGLANVLGDAPQLHVTEDVFELQTVLETILEQVHNRLSGIEVYGQEGLEARGVKQRSDQGEVPLEVGLMNRGTPRPALLPPSPEPRQKRKKSYAVL